MLQSLPNERAKCFTYESLRSTSIFFLGMWAHLGRFFLDQDWLYSFTQKSEYPISLMQPGIHRRKTKSADCSPDRAGTWATSLALRVTWMKDIEEKLHANNLISAIMEPAAVLSLPCALPICCCGSSGLDVHVHVSICC